MTWTNSKNYGLPGRTDTPPQMGQAPWSYNITPSYATKRGIFELGISYDGPNIAAYQWQTGNIGTVTGPFGDNYYYGRTQVDAQATYYLGRGFSAPLRKRTRTMRFSASTTAAREYMTQREYYKPIYYGGLRWEGTTNSIALMPIVCPVFPGAWVRAQSSVSLKEMQ